jgi:hypothetical protein
MAKREYKFDYDRAETLLSIIEKVANVTGSRMMAISGEAMAELNEMEEALKLDQAKHKEAEKKELASKPHPSRPIDHIEGTEEQQEVEKKADEEPPYSPPGAGSMFPPPPEDKPVRRV